MVSGLNGGGLVLQNNGGGDTAVGADGAVTFASAQSGAAYAITVLTQPTSPDQTCTVSNGSGTIAQSNVTNVTVACVDNYQPTYTPAAKGDPQGTPTTQTIDATGGSVTSADGRITVAIPAGALPGATVISIQPISNTTPNGLDSGYRLEPEGTTFATPITLTFQLSPTEAIGIDSTFIATQHADGLWYSQQNQQRDATAQTVSIATSHFSDWSLAETLELKPAKARVKTSTAASFPATILVVKQEDDELANPSGEELALPMPTSIDKVLNGSKLWAVNGIEGGNTTIGQIRDPGSFSAPNQAPSPPDVTVSLTAQLGRAKVIAPAIAEIYQLEIWTGTTNITGIDGTHFQTDVTFTQRPLSLTHPSQLDLVFEVQSGVVRAKIPATTGAGCPQSISPDTHTIAPDDGSMEIKYSLASGPEEGIATGGGTTVWPATLTIVCPNGTLVLDTAIQAPWWPLVPGAQLTATDGVLDANVGSQSVGGGTIHLVRE
jgi:hypothetical protein